MNSNDERDVGASRNCQVDIMFYVSKSQHSETCHNCNKYKNRILVAVLKMQLHCVCPSELKCRVLKQSFQMSWNTMMEGFRRHEGETGQNPIEMAKQQNDEIKKTLMETVGANDDTLEQRLEQLRKDNDAKEKELQTKKREIRDRKNFYKDNAPHHVQQQLPRVFDADKSQQKIVEIED